MGFDMGVDMEGVRGIRAEWIILADAAEMVNSKLYLLGGGWDRLVINTPFPVAHRCAVAISFSIPWNETNQRHQFDVRVEDEDGKPLVNAGGHFEVGRPAGSVPGQAQRFQLAMSTQLTFERAGSYIIAALIEGQEVGRATFVVTSGSGQANRAGG